MIEFTPLTDRDQLEEIIEISNKPRSYGVLLFKHSPRCGVSLNALKQLRSAWPYNSEKVAVFLVDVIKNRNISNEISAAYGVQHESPQVLFIKNGQCVGNASHWHVSIETVNRWINA